MVYHILITNKGSHSNFIVSCKNCGNSFFIFISFFIQHVIFLTFHIDWGIMCNKSNLWSLVVSFCLLEKKYAWDVFLSISDIYKYISNNPKCEKKNVQ